MTKLKAKYSRLSLGALVSLCVAPLLCGCFTGVESTPKITDSEVRRNTSATAAEETFLQPIVDSLNASALTAGLPLLTIDEKVRVLLEPAAETARINVGDTLRILSIEPATTLDGRPVANILLLANSGQQYYYRTNSTPNKINNLGALNIPFCIPLNVIDAIRTKLKGQHLFITTSSRFDLNDNLHTGRRFVPVEVLDVEPGNAFYPIRLLLRDDMNATFRIYLSIDSTSALPRKFGSQFSLTDPRLHYPAITDATWQNIVNGRVEPGMTRAECRMSLGEPDNIDRQAGYSSLREIWTYKNGRYLIFIDGLLDSFRQ